MARHWFERWSEHAFLVKECIIPAGNGILTPEQDEILAKATAARKKVEQLTLGRVLTRAHASSIEIEGIL